MVVLQEIPETPVIDQLPLPVGVAPPLGPLTVAVKVKVVPKTAVLALVLMVTVGVSCEIVALKVLLAVLEL